MRCPTLVHVHPYETVREAIDILREYGVSQMPVVKAEPPVTAGEVVGLGEREGAARPAVHRSGAPGRRRWSGTCRRRCRIVGAGEPVSAATAALEKSDALLVHDDGKPAGVLTRQDLLGFLAAGLITGRAALVSRAAVG